MAGRFELVTKNHPAAELAVVALEGLEEISKPFRFDVRVRTSVLELDRIVLGEEAALTLRGTSGERRIAGIVGAARAESHVPTTGEAYHRLRIVPRLAALALGKNSRVFQDQTVPEIVDAVLGGAAVERSWRTRRAYPKRAYCVQYEQSDLSFVRRILAEEGIFFFADPAAAAEDPPRDAIVFADHAGAYQPIAGAPALRFRAPDGLGRDREHVEAIHWRRRLASGAVSLLGFDVQRPSTRLGATAAVPEGTVGRDRERYEHDLEWSRARVSSEAAAVGVEQDRRRESVGEGRSSSVRLSVGAWFEIEGAERADLDGRFVPVRLEHEGKIPEEASGRASGGADEVYVARFTCVEATVPARPAPRKRRPRQVIETATVVGPPGEEIHTDELGRIKVEFHWDRQGKRDDRSSCWIRALQPWAGSAWGAQFIPRVGMEVVVSFLGGDTDRPVVLGALYNGENPPPFALPAQKTRSGIRTRSTPGGGGHNELRFDDEASQEEIYLHAQRDFVELVEHDRKREVRGEESVRVVGRRTLDALEDNIRNVTGNEIVTVQKNLVLHVVGAHVFHVDGVRGAGGGAATEELEDRPPEEIAAAGGAEMDSAIVAQMSRAFGRRGAQLVWLAEQLGEPDYAVAARAEEEAAALAATVVPLYAEARALATAAPLPDMAEKAAPLLDRVEEARAQISTQITRALDPMPPEMHRFQRALVEQLQEVDQAINQADGVLQEAIAGRPPLPDLAGLARGGGGGDEDKKKKDATWTSSQVKITGGGSIDSADGFKITTGGSSIESKDGKITLTSGGSSITIESGSITINSGGPVTIKGNPVDVNP